MLMQIDIFDFITIQSLHLELNHGTTMITGETGAGKSIFIEALELSLGGRASQHMVRAGKEKADLCLTFNIKNFPHVTDYLKSLDLHQGHDECMIRRVITPDGHSRCYLNGIPTALHVIREVGEQLFHLHGQHAQQVILKTETQRELLDIFGNHLELAQHVKTLAQNLKLTEDKIKQLKTKAAERTEKMKYLEFQINELELVALQKGEWETLEVEHHQLSHSEELAEAYQRMLQLLTNENDQQTLLKSCHELRRILDSIQTIEPKSKAWLNLVQAIIIQFSDLASDIQNSFDQIDLNHEKINLLETRISQIFDLARKYKVQPNDLVSFKNKLKDEYETLASNNENIKQLEQEKIETEKTYTEAAAALSKKRMRAAIVLSKEITKIIRNLSLPHADFQIQLEKDMPPFSAHGREKINFLIKTNPDAVHQPIHKIISGGELSRLSLALHLSLSEQTNIPILIFDEVDTGLSGATSEKIGKLLRNLGHTHQVFCITHQAQVAACGHHHLLVEKSFIKNETHTSLRLLDTQEKTKEIARMIGGETITDKTLAHAKEILAVS